ncbi:MAG: hypothetical protein IKE70_01590 [Bacilli bacterium]|nr:hypothetical protein [Bacilli bacterium]
MDAISEYTSSKNIAIKGKKGYQNYVKTLNKIASQYENKNYTTSSRIMGYNGQKETIENLDSSNIPSNMETTSLIEEGSGDEYYNGLGGDNLYRKDYQLVSNIYKDSNNTHGETGLVAYRIDRKTTPTFYFVATRMFNKLEENNYDFSILTVSLQGKLERNNPLLSYNEIENEIQQNNAIRPIITLKKDLQISSGKGDLNNPYKLK